MPSVTRKPWPPFAKWSNRNNQEAQPWGHSAPRQSKASYGQHYHGTLTEIQVGGCWSPSIQSRPLSLRLCHFWSPKKGSEGQTIHLGRRHQAVCAELVQNAAPGTLRDSHSPPSLAVGQVPQQPGPILLTYSYWFLFLGLREFYKIVIHRLLSQWDKCLYSQDQYFWHTGTGSQRSPGNFTR